MTTNDIYTQIINLQRGLAFASPEHALKLQEQIDALRNIAQKEVDNEQVIPVIEAPLPVIKAPLSVKKSAPPVNKYVPKKGIRAERITGTVKKEKEEVIRKVLRAYDKSRKLHDSAVPAYCAAVECYMVLFPDAQRGWAADRAVEIVNCYRINLKRVAKGLFT